MSNISKSISDVLEERKRKEKHLKRRRTIMLSNKEIGNVNFHEISTPTLINLIKNSVLGDKQTKIDFLNEFYYRIEKNIF